MPIKVIINADDFGLNQSVNNCIGEAISNGYITSSTILANSNYLKEVKEIVDAHPGISYGLHLNLSYGPSLTRNILFRKRGLIDANNEFIGREKAISTCQFADKDMLNAIYFEWEAQLARLIEYGIYPSHVDGHHHVHTISGLEHVLSTLLTSHGISKLRNKYIYPEKDLPLKERIEFHISSLLYKSKIYDCTTKLHSTDANKIIRVLESFQYKLLYKDLIKINSFRTTDYFVAYEELYKSIREGFDLNTIQGKTIELMCHPGHPNYKNEFEIVKNKSIMHNAIEFISYNEL